MCAYLHQVHWPSLAQDLPAAIPMSVPSILRHLGALGVVPSIHHHPVIVVLRRASRVKLEIEVLCSGKGNGVLVFVAVGDRMSCLHQSSGSPRSRHTDGSYLRQAATHLRGRQKQNKQKISQEQHTTYSTDRITSDDISYRGWSSPNRRLATVTGQGLASLRKVSSGSNKQPRTVLLAALSNETRSGSFLSFRYAATSARVYEKQRASTHLCVQRH